MAERHEIQVIARIHSDFREKFGIPRQSGLVETLRAAVVFEPEYRNPEAVRGLDGFTHLWLIWQFSLAVRQNWSPTVRPPRLGGNTRSSPPVRPTVPTPSVFPAYVWSLYATIQPLVRSLRLQAPICWMARRSMTSSPTFPMRTPIRTPLEALLPRRRRPSFRSSFRRRFLQLSRWRSARP